MGQKFKFTNNIVSKKLDVSVEGIFNETDGIAYVNEYNKVINSIDATGYDLNLDCTKLSVTASNVIDMLEGCFRAYKEDGFKMVRFILPEGNNAILKMQFSRLAKKVELKNYEILV